MAANRTQPASGLTTAANCQVPRRQDEDLRKVLVLREPHAQRTGAWSSCAGGARDHDSRHAEVSDVRTVVPSKRRVVLPPESVPNFLRCHAMNACDRAPERGLASRPRPLTTTDAVNSPSSVGKAERERFRSFCFLPEMSLLHRVLEVDRNPRFVRPFTTRPKTARSACGLPHNHQDERREHHPARHRSAFRATRVKAPDPLFRRERINQDLTILTAQAGNGRLPAVSPSWSARAASAPRASAARR